MPENKDISGVELGKLLNAVGNLHEDVKEIKTDVKEGFKTGNRRMSKLEVQQATNKTAVKIIGTIVLALVVAIIKVFLS